MKVLLKRFHLSGHTINVCLALEHRQYFATPPLVFTAKWRPRNERRNSILMTYHYPDLRGAFDWLNDLSHMARPIRSTTHLWVVIRHQYGISALVPDVICGKKTVVAPRNVSYFLRLDSRLKIKTGVYFFNKYWLFQLTKVRIEMKIVLKDLPELTCTTWRCYRHQMVKIHKGERTAIHPCSTDQPNRVLRRVRHIRTKNCQLVWQGP